MKKLLKYFVLALVLILPFSVNAAEKVEITDAYLEDYKSEYADGFLEPTVNGLTIGVKGTFSSLYNQFVRYNFNITNKDNVDYVLSCNEERPTTNNDTDAGTDPSDTGVDVPDDILPEDIYSCEIKNDGVVTYRLDCWHGNLKANSETACNLDIYTNENIDRRVLTNNIYVTTDEITLPLEKKTPTVTDKVTNAAKKATKILTNPKTSSKYLIIGLIIIGAIVGTIAYFKGNKKVKTMVLLLGIMALPISTFAISTISLNVNAEVEVVAYERFAYIGQDREVTDYDFEYGETWNNFLNSDRGANFHSEILLYSQAGHLTGYGLNEGEEHAPNIRIYAPYYWCVYGGGDKQTCANQSEEELLSNMDDTTSVYYWIESENEKIIGKKNAYDDWYYTFDDPRDDESTYIPD